MNATVLAYHAVEPSIPDADVHELTVTTRAFAEQMAFLAERRTVVPLADALDGPSRRNGKPVVAITFDDGYAGVLHEAAPILKRHGLPATIFVPTAHLGGRNQWDGLDHPAFRVLDADDLRELEDLGVSVESHGHRHIRYDLSPIEDVRADIAASTQVLADVLGRRPSFLAYPWGPSSAASRRAVADAGFRGAFSIDERHRGRFAFGRVPVRPHESMRKFALKTAGGYQALRYSQAAVLAAAVTRPLRRRGPGAGAPTE